MGVVYAVMQDQPRRTVAVKVMKHRSRARKAPSAASRTNLSCWPG